MEKYLDKKLSPEERAEDLLDRMSTEEKMAQVKGVLYGHGDFDASVKNGIGQVSTLEFRMIEDAKETAELQRKLQKKVMDNSPHHIPAVFHMEGLCGPLLQDAVSFPEAIGRGASFDPELEEKIGSIVGRQETAMGISQVFAPVLDISRDSRMGRQSESYGEDPVLAAAMGTAYVKGVQDRETDGLKAESAAKHFIAFHNSLGGIHGASSETGSRLLREVYAKPFQAAVTVAKLRGIMPCYDSLDGKPVHADKSVLTGLLREEMGFDGVTVSDYGAVSNVHMVQKLYESVTDAGYACMEAGLDVELPNGCCYNEELKERFDGGKADMTLLNRAVYRILRAKFRMGLFEHPFALEGEEWEKAYYHPQDREISLRSALESIVLLKNKNHILPLGKEAKKVAVIGCHADNARFFFGGYTHVSMVEAMAAAANSLAGVDAANRGRKDMVCIPGTQIQCDESKEFDRILKTLHPGCKSLLRQLEEDLPDWDIRYAYGYSIAGSDESRFGEALELAEWADVVLLTLGGKNGSGSIATMGEGVDGTDINLPSVQDAFLEKAALFGKPMVGLHFDGRPISSDVADRTLDAILECWNPAERGAEAVVKVLTGVYNPSGRLTVSVARNAGQIPVYYNHPNGSMWHQGESIGFQNYVDMPHSPRYFFGYGLSYTEFSYRNGSLSAESVTPDGTVTVTADIRNAGTCYGTEIVQLYLTDSYAGRTRPVEELAGFARVSLMPGEEKTVSFTVSPGQTAFLDDDMRWKVEKGEVQVKLGSSSEDIRWSSVFRITENQWIDGKTRAFWAEARIGI